MKLPTRLSIALGTLLTGVGALTLEVQMSPVAHRLSLLALAFVLYLVHPGEGGILPSANATATPPYEVGAPAPVKSLP